MSQQIKDFAKDYETKATKNIADLSEVSTELELIDDEFEFTDKKTGAVKTVKQKVVNINGVDYRVPASVFQQLNVMIKDNPNLKRFKVIKTGTLMETKYTVIPLS